jgi:hypothetical protein
MHMSMQRRRNGVFGNERAPSRIAGIERRDRGEKLGAHRRAQSVGADEQIALGGRAVGKSRRHAVTILLDADQFPAAVIMPVGQLAAQHVVEPIPGGQVLRIGPFQRHPAGGIEESPRRHLDAEILPPGNAGVVERLPQQWVGNNAGATPGQLGFALMDIDRKSVPAQQQRREQSGQRPADHDGAAAAMGIVRCRHDQSIERRAAQGAGHSAGIAKLCGSFPLRHSPCILA